MRKYRPQNDASVKNYYEDRFFAKQQIERFSPLNTPFEEELSAINTEILDAYIELGTLVVWINPQDNLIALENLKNFGYEILSELSSVDFLAKDGEFEIFYQLLSISKKRRMRLKLRLKEKQMLNSVCEIYASANWAEREIYDMMGVLIKNHPNLKRLLMPDDWFGHPLRKSYPLHGDERAKWYEIDKIYGKEFRNKIGEENRNSAFVDSKDTKNFSHLYHEVPFGDEKTAKKYKQEYQENSGVKFVKKIKRDGAKIIDKRF